MVLLEYNPIGLPVPPTQDHTPKPLLEMPVQRRVTRQSAQQASKATPTQFKDTPIHHDSTSAPNPIDLCPMTDKLPVFRPDDRLVSFETGRGGLECRPSAETSIDHHSCDGFITLPTPDHTHQTPVRCVIQEKGGVDVIGGTSFLQRHYDHPDFTAGYTIGLQEKLGRGIHAVITKTTVA